MAKDKIILIPSNVKETIVDLPGSKSISNRVLLIASLGVGKTEISNLLFSDDTKVMIEALIKLGVKIIPNRKLKKCTIVGVNNFFPNKDAKLYVGNSGTTIRPLTAVLAFNKGNYFIHGTDRMHDRPIGDLVNSLNLIGAKIEYKNKNNYPPLVIPISNITKDKIAIKGNVSSQFLTSILIASPILSTRKDIYIKLIGNLISKPYIDITLKLLKIFGLEVEVIQNNKFKIKSNQHYLNPSNIKIEGDASSSTYFLAAAAISGKKIRVNGIGKKSIQGDVLFVKYLKKMGVKIALGDYWIEVRESFKIKAIDEDCNDIPDAAMTIAILALYADGISVLRNIASWRVKETDRISAMSKELKKLGAIIEEGEDFIKITPPLKINDAVI
ncbi:3-phosphoshikimate 1-carboxyvinyltransferase, partial [Alphaproteobacteria bacterium]|nr:3-phosphoshikimate 1-carboxyvinyltransferase [Alphaproteobacteria bacterium]